MLFLIVLCLLPLFFSGNLSPIYVTNSTNLIDESNCRVNGKSLLPCATLDELPMYMLPQYAHIHIYFIHESYTINKNGNIILRVLTASLTLQPLNAENIVNITCIGDLSITVTYTLNFGIKSIRFINCGKTRHLLEFQYYFRIRKVKISILNAEFIRGRKCAITMQYKSFVDFQVHNSTFIGNQNTLNYSIYINSNWVDCKLSNTIFKNHSTGSVYFSSYEGSLEADACLFTSNSNHNQRGSAISINDSIVLVINNCIFFTNSDTAVQVSQNISLSINTTRFIGNNVGGSSAGGVFHLQYSSRVIIKNSYFTGNNATRGSIFAGCIENEYMHEWRLGIVNSIFEANSAEYGSVLGVDYCGKLYVDINSSNFTNNEATYGVLSASYINHFFLKLTNVFFTGNIASIGGVIYVSVVQLFILKGGNFINNTAYSYGGAIRLYNVKDMIVNMSSFHHNIANDEGGAIKIDCVQHEKCKYRQLTSIFVDNTANTGGAVYVNEVLAWISHSNFVGNIGSIGGALYIKDSTLLLKKFQSHNNSAKLQGGSIASAERSKLIFCGNSLFSGDKVISETGLGGAIYVDDTTTECKTDTCLINWYQNTSIHFVSTYASNGFMIFGGMINLCLQLNDTLSQFLFYNNNAYDLLSSGITSKPLQVCFCSNHYPYIELMMTVKRKAVYPGKTFYVNVACIDQMQLIVPCDVRAEYSTGVDLGQGQSLRPIQNCTRLLFRAFTTDVNSTQLTLNGGLCNSENRNEVIVSMKILPCPKGFQNIQSKCQCNPRLKEIFQTLECDIESGTMTIYQGWLGFNKLSVLASKNCPLSYCFQDNITINVSDTERQCNHYRRGILCGQCLPNHSVMLGSWHCGNCSNSNFNFIWLGILIAASGVALVLFLLLTKMTVSSGTMNGLLFYANIISFSGLLDKKSNSIHQVLLVFLSWINLDFGINVCFYDGMDVYQKTWLQFVFPFYMWLLVVLIIIFCHYSSRVMKFMGMRNIEVLATLFLISYSKLLKNMLTIFSGINIGVADATNKSEPLTLKTVWVYDGEIEYLGRKHLPLFIAALLILVFLFLPYTLLLIFGHSLRSLPRRKGLQWVHSRVVSSVLDAYHAPYSQHHRYWTGLGLAVRCCLFSVFSISYNIEKNLFCIAFGVVLLLCYRQLFCSKIYRNKISNFLELFYLTNLTILSITLLYTGNIYPFTISVALAFTVFIILVIYHSFLVAKQHIGRVKYLKMLTVKLTSPITNRSCQTKEEKAPKKSTTFVELRESLLEN